jgi:hypothetical protein
VLLDLVLAHPSQALTLDHLMQVPHSLATQGLYVPGLVGDDEFREGFTSGLLLILVSEIGDKTFFVAMLLAVRQSDNSGGNQQSLNSNNNNSNSDGLALKGESSLLDKATERRLVVYVGTVAALGLMTIISCVIGRSFHSLDQVNYLMRERERSETVSDQFARGMDLHSSPTDEFDPSLLLLFLL